MTKMVKFYELYDDEKIFNYGIKLDNGNVVCGCCGSVFEADEVVIEEELPWIDIQFAIKGE